jgi:hypothetical protein
MHISTSHCLVKSLLIGVVVGGVVAGRVVAGRIVAGRVVVAGRIVVVGGVVAGIGIVGPGHEGGLHHGLHGGVGHELRGWIEGRVVGVDVDGIEVLLRRLPPVEVVAVVDAFAGVQVELDQWLPAEKLLDVLIEEVLGQQQLGTRPASRNTYILLNVMIAFRQEFALLGVSVRSLISP